MTEYLKSRPMMIAAIGCIAVSVCGFYSAWWLFVLSLFFIFFLVCAILKSNIGMIFAIAVVLLTSLNCFGAIIKADRLGDLRGKEIRARVNFCSLEYESEEYNRGIVEVLECSSIEKGTKISVTFYENVLQNGDIFIADMKLTGVAEEYKSINYGENIFINGSITHIEKTGQRDFVTDKIEGLKKYIRNRLFNNLGSGEAATMCALVFGERDYFTDEFYSAVKGAGVAHVMVVSGMHLSIIITAVLGIFEKIIKNHILKASLILLVVALLCAVCGFTMSILRASVTYLIIAVSILLKRPYSGEIALSAAVCLIIMFMPFSIFNVAFQLSSASTFGILAVALPIIKYIKSRGIVRSKLLLIFYENIIVSISAMIMVLPITIYIFGYVSLAGILVNFLIAMPVTYGLVLGIAGLSAYFVLPPVGYFMLSITELVIVYVNKLILTFGNNEFSVIITPRWCVFVSVAVIILIFYILFACKKRIDMIKLKEMRRKIASEEVKRKNANYV